MPAGNQCPQCGTPLTAGALAGLCPACLLKQGAADETATGGQSPTFQPPPIAELAPLFPQLEILELIGKGGMGAVYKARQKELDRIVALKILPPGIGQDAAFAGRFAREAKALAKLNHPGIVTLYEFGSSGRESAQIKPEHSQEKQSRFTSAATPLYYFLMEFVDGVNLRQLLHAGRIAPREALAIVPQICDALQYAHDQGIVHRDIKPENILLDRRGRVKVADFGLAKIVEGRDALPRVQADQQVGPTDLTAAGKVMGTPNYMAPEQKEHPDAVDHRADIYALGVVFYQMLTGELPGKCIEPPSSKVQIDVRLDEVVLRALENKPERRYQQVSEVKTCVETIVGNAGVAPGSMASPAAINEAEWNNPRNWTGPKWLSIYFSKRDSRTWVPKQIPGFGWTVNLGNPRGAFALLAIVGAIIIALVVVPLAIFMPGHSRPIKSFYIGQTWFPEGDSIEITSVERTPERMVVKGHFNLVSHDQATLAFHITTSTDISVPEDSKNRIPISKGRGDFELVHSHLVPGLPHVAMYADGKVFANLYFGTQAEALEESKATWITNSATPVLQFRLVLPESSTEPADWLPSVSRHDRLHLARQVLLDDSVIAQAGVDFNPDGGREIEIRFTDAGAQRFEGITAANIGRQLAIVYRGQVLSAPAIQSVIPGGLCQVDGSMSAEQIHEIVDGLNHTRSSTTGTRNFSPVRELILPFKPEPGFLFGWANLDSGAVLTTTSLDWRSRSGQAWMRTNGLDVVVTMNAKALPALMGFDMIVVRAPTNGWNIVTPADVVQFWNFQQEAPRQEQVFGAQPGQSDTFFFQTREGRRGILQILGFAESPPGVKIRYKLVQAADASGAIDPTTGLPVVLGNGRIDPATGLPVTPADTTGTAIDPNTGLPMTPGNTGAIDPATGLPTAATGTAALPLANAPGADKTPGDDAALPAIQAWLSLVDGGQYAESWQQASVGFRALVTQADWVNKGESIRKPLGQLLSRKLEKTEPNGPYFVAKFDSSFEGLKAATETATFALAANGQWRAAGYLILPRGNTNNAAVEPAQAWLQDIDNGNYAQSWTNAAAYFQQAITSEKLAESLQQVRQPLGSLVFRKVISAQEMSSLPGAPDSRYIVMQFETSFSNKKSAIETVTFMLEKDGQWRAAGYYIK
ncbi:MAG: DUF4019 domain-containing protein [Verrucomicrobiia bacterium]